MKARDAFTRITVAIGVVSILVTSCGAPGPSYTLKMCDRLLAANAARDADRVEQVVDEMSDIGTEDDPRAVEPRVYVHVLTLQNAIREGSQPSFNASLDALLAECAKVE